MTASKDLKAGLLIPPEILSDRELELISKVVLAYMKSLPDGLYGRDDITEAAKALGLTRKIFVRRVNILIEKGYLHRSVWCKGTVVTAKQEV